MTERAAPLAVRVRGDLACFTRPEMKVERVSYPVPTPSAARGILEAIFWKPEFRWRVEEVWVLRDIRYMSLLRNEVNSRANPSVAKDWLRRGGGYDASADRAQRHTLALREVDYVIRAHVEVKDGISEDPAKFRDQFRRRVRTGACFHRPYLGCREFAADFSEPDGTERPIERTEDLGRMLLEIDYSADGTGRGTPRFFDAKLERGVLRILSDAAGSDS